MSEEETVKTDINAGGIAGDRLRALIERIERLADEKQAIADDMKTVFAEAKGSGFDVKVMREVIKRRKKDKADLQEEDTLMDLYKRALGME